MNTDDNNGAAYTGDQPTNATSTSDTTAPPAEEKLSFTRTEFNSILNSAIASHTRRLDSKFEKRLTEALAAARGEPAKPADPEQARALDALRAIEADRAAQLAEAQERERTLLEREMRSETEHTLSMLGCVDPRAARLILTEDDRVRRNAGGDLVFVGDDGAEVDLATGVRAWLSTDSGKRYVAPKLGGDGSGTIFRSDRYRALETSKPSRGEAERVIAAWVLGGRR